MPAIEIIVEDFNGVFRPEEIKSIQSKRRGVSLPEDGSPVSIRVSGLAPGEGYEAINMEGGKVFLRRTKPFAEKSLTRLGLPVDPVKNPGDPITRTDLTNAIIRPGEESMLLTDKLISQEDPPTHVGKVIYSKPGDYSGQAPPQVKKPVRV